MTIRDLDEKLVGILSEYSNELRDRFPDDGRESVSKSDLSELSRQTFYALNEMRKSIIEYLSEDR